MSRYAKWAQSEHSEAGRIAITFLLGPVFLGLLPFLVAGVGRAWTAGSVSDSSGSEE
jgi:hypothetical protein